MYLGNALVWWASVDQILKLLPDNTKELEYVQILKDSIINKKDLEAIRPMSTVK